MTLGDKIRNLRLEHGMTMEELAQRIGVQRSAVNKYEKGIVTNLKRSTIAALARELGVSPSYFLDESDPLSLTREDEERQLLSAYRAADPKIRAAALRMLMDSASEKKDSVKSAI